jgi:23S rRNA pseudouridine1911/1915/1917 synthase
MRARAIERTYLALVRGDLAAATGTIEAPIGRHPVRRHLMAVVAGGRPAVTHYTEIARTEK